MNDDTKRFYMEVFIGPEGITIASIAHSVKSVS